jgi:hypothetical protein
MAAAYRCEACESIPDWDLERYGDAVASWACHAHLPGVLRDLQRKFEITEISVKPSRRSIRVYRRDDGQWCSKCFRCREWLTKGESTWAAASVVAYFHAVLWHATVEVAR